MKKIISLVLCTLSVTALFTACSLGGKSDEPAFKLRKLPDIGKYEKSEVRSYYHGGPVSELIASDGYGEIVPFIYDVREFAPYKKKAGLSPVSVGSWGFATKDGKIISGGVYSSVKTITSKDGKTVYAAESFLRTAEDLSTLKSDSLRTKTTLIGSDGSWTADVDGVIYRDGGVSEDEEDLKNYIETFDAEGHITLYDFSGNVIFDAKQAMPDEKIESVYYAKNDKIIIEITDREKGGSKVVCVNSKGEKLTDINIRGYGVLKMINGVFLICRTDNGEKSNLSDLNGNVLLDKDYDLISYDSNSKSFICVLNDKKKVSRYDANGQLLNEFKAEYNGSEIRYILKNKKGPSLAYKDSDGKYLLYNTVTGKKIKLDFKKIKKNADGEPSFLPLYTHGDGEETFILLTRKDGTQELYDAFGTYIMSMTDFYGPLDITPDGGYCYRSKDNKFVVRSHSPRNDFEVDLKDKSSAYFSVMLYDDKYVAFLCTDEKGENEYYKVYDIEKKEIAFDKLTAFESYTAGGKTYYTMVKDGISTLIDRDGTQLISLSDGGIF